MTRVQRVGWGLLLFVSILMALNGVGWYFAGPARSLSYSAEVAGLSEEDFSERFPQLVEALARNRRQVAIWYFAFGCMAFLAGVEGFRSGSRWAWYATWLIPAAPILIGLVYMPDGRLDPESGVLLTFGGLAPFGQVLAGPYVNRQGERT